MDWKHKARGSGSRMAALFCRACLLLLVPVGVSQQTVQVEDSGAEPVEIFATAIRFYIDLVNYGSTPCQVSVTPEVCCLHIEEGDTDCEIMELKPQRILELGPENGNNSGTALFLFRNLYARYRIGYCNFIISSEEEHPLEWRHSFPFDTSPSEGEASVNCSGIDQDPDRGCTPVDCAIKYKGRRNFYRNSTGKCEPVVDCNTRGKDGVTIVAYYDWEHNRCTRYDWLEENSFSQIESDTEIPVDIDPSQSEYFPEFEPHLLKKMAPLTRQLQCNHGRAEGIHCTCDEGWVSSGIHMGNPLEFHWCDIQKADPSAAQHGLRRLTKVQEIAAIVALSLANLLLFIVWVYGTYRLCCKEKCAAKCGKRARAKQPETTNLLLQEE